MVSAPLSLWGSVLRAIQLVALPPVTRWAGYYPAVTSLSVLAPRGWPRRGEVGEKASLLGPELPLCHAQGHVQSSVALPPNMISSQDGTEERPLRRDEACLTSTVSSSCVSSSCEASAAGSSTESSAGRPRRSPAPGPRRRGPPPARGPGAPARPRPPRRAAG